MLVFRERDVFDEMHQKRLFVIHMENVRIFCSSPDLKIEFSVGQVTTSENHLLIGSADAAPGYENIANVVTEGFAGEGVMAIVPAIDEMNGDWDVLYPFSQVCTPYLNSVLPRAITDQRTVLGALQDRFACRASIRGRSIVCRPSEY